jgi:hypothetical protein
MLAARPAPRANPPERVRVSHLRSFDFFDTLVARHHGSPDGFYRHLGRLLGIAGFPALRRRAERHAATKDLAGVYRWLGNAIGVDAERSQALAEIEFEEDRRWLLPIRANIAALVEDLPGSVVVSDTTLSVEQVRSMLARFLPAGVDPAAIRIVCTHGGKARGDVWASATGLQGAAVERHVGDNLWSDVIRPRLSRGRVARTAWFRGSAPTWLERMLTRSGYAELARHLRAARLANPYPPDDVRAGLYVEQIEFNVPMIIWGSDHLHRCCRERGFEDVRFMTRDGCLWQRWFTRRYPGYAVAELHSSRNVLRAPSGDYVEYLRRLHRPGRTIFVDTMASGRSLTRFFRAHLPGVTPDWFAMIWDKRRDVFRPTAYLVRAGADSGFSAIEKLNSDLVGTLCGYEASRGPLRAPLEYDPRWVRVYHEAFDAAIEALPVDLEEQSAPPRHLVGRLLTGYFLGRALGHPIRYVLHHPAGVPGSACDR